MNIYVLIGHQNQGSFCHAIASAVIEELKAADHELVYHDLYAENFDPILPHDEIPKDARLDPVVEQHCREIAAADGFVVVHPNWWAMPPAILKGWMDRVLRQGVAYQFGPGGVEPLLKGKRAVVITTSNTPRDDELHIFGDPLENLWKACVFNFCGVEDFYRRNFESIILSTPDQRREWLDEVRSIIRERFPA
ncbi:MAG: NAD(P)H-dependent oxidoreductase [Planctomycetes bacterium]|nr:NAD(P)H-dependent oxidoreductase [Planctomycetota bacterium]MBU4400710.1 NAD(P)H-dependent oxidoreductase [Planctomycetota bacterium]MCG2681992.1 NAD(P)H-dependent oxidoreductase [Planctomycetales bacterium]